MNEPTQVPPQASRGKRLTTLSLYSDAASLADDGLADACRVAALSSGLPHAVLGILQPGAAWFGAVFGTYDGGADNRRAVNSLCTFVLHRGAAVALEDARADPMLGADPLVAGTPGIGAMVGVPLRKRDDAEPLGVLVAYGPDPGALTPTQQAAFEAAAGGLTSQVSLRGRFETIRAKHVRHLGRLQMLEGLLAAANRFAIIALDTSGTILSFSPGAEELLQYGADRVTGVATPRAFMSDDELRAALAAGSAPPAASRVTDPEALLQALTDRRAWGLEREWTWRRRDGTSFPAGVVVGPMRSEEGELTGLLMIGRDVTERKQLDRLKDEFVSTVSHELRTPLTSIEGALGLLQGGVAGPMSPEVTRLVGLARSNSKRLKYLVDDILDISKLDSDRMQLDLRQVALPAMIHESAEANAPYADRHGVRLVCRDLPEGATVAADAPRILQVLANLISNAVKFSPRDGVVVVGVEARPKAWRVLVVDRGPGIPEDFRGRIFERFTQGGGYRDSVTKGTGLGLAIVKAIVEQHGGDVGFESEIGVGTTFWFDLPAG